MVSKESLGRTIKNKRLARNMTMDALAKRAGITRATLSAIENGTGNYSIDTLLIVLGSIDVDIDITEVPKSFGSRKRATRINTKQDKDFNRWLIMAIEQYCSFVNKKSDEIYPKMVEKHVIDTMEENYDLLHGMSTSYMNDYIDALMKN